MEKFKELEKNKISVNEAKIAEMWKEMDILNRTIDNRSKENNFVFYDGPATANGMPGLHHMLSKLLKDTFTKYKTMQGHRVIRKAGWDTHGLPVELEVEKQLGFKSKTDIEAYGIEEFNKKCKESVFKNEASFRKYTEKMGQFIDLDNAYVTYDNDYIESVWWILNKFHEEGLIYEGHKILPYCSRCGTGLSSHEVAQGYKEVTVDTVVVPMKLVSEDAYFLVWTTTPWTLLSNVALAVNPKEKYVKVASRGYNFILAKQLAPAVLGEDYEVIEEFDGSALEFKEYEQLLPFLKVDKKAFYVTLADYVTMTDGTGIVHIAPAFGEDDYQVGRKYDLPFLNPVGEDGTYTEGPWKGTFVIDADLDVIKYLKENDKLFKKQKVVHNYPHCWRCHTPLLYYSKPSWYIEVTKFKEKLIENNNGVNWYPDYIGEKRFGNWLENLNDWAVSRKRYWGTPLNIWKCECGHTHSIGSRAELKERAIEEIDENIELHRPYVDDIHIKCDKCGKTMTREPEVVDVWFDSGSMPFAQYHYPFENKELFDEQFPADFISEGIDQTRGWFYVLLAIGTLVMGKSPYKNVLVNDMILDKNARKMGKSNGNALDPFELIEEYGADTLRWYLPYVSPAWTPTKFDVDGLKEVHSKFFNTIKNTYNFFILYANTDGINPRDYEIAYEDREEIDRWLLSKYNKLVNDVTSYMDEYDMTKSVRTIQNFVNEDLSNWYIRRNRRRFWASEFDDSKKAVYKTTYEVLVGLSKLIAPIIPFISEEMFMKLTDKESVHLEDYPKVNEELIDEHIEERMDLVRSLISLGRNVREESKIKVRQPISEVLLDGKHENLISDLSDLIKEELNVKEVVFEKDLSSYMNFEVKPNFRAAGPVFGKNVKLFADYLANIDDDTLKKLEAGEEITATIEDNDYVITNALIDIRISSKEGFNVQMENNNFVILNTTLNDALLMEGRARELVSKVQQLRKNSDFEVTDKINIKYSSDSEFEKVLSEFGEFIKKETLALEFIKEECQETFDINGLEVKLAVERI